MALSLKKLIFLLLFSCFQILFVFSYSTGFELIVISLFLLFLLFYFWYFKLKIVLDYKIGLLWAGLLLSILVSSLFTHSLPLSLDSLVFYTASFCTFIFFRNLGSKGLFSKNDFAFFFLTIGLALSIFFIIFFVFPSFSNFLPPINVITIEYGHSHFAALLLLLIPLGWWYIFSNEYSDFRFKHPILILFYILLVLTFGRFAILLSFLQLPFLYKFISKKYLKKRYLYLVGVALFLALVSVVLFSIKTNDSCFTQELRNQICKPIAREVRHEYFKQALLSFKSNPLVGYGPGTFSLVTEKYNAVIEYKSIYVHNAFLQVFAESGLFAGLFYFVLLYFLFKNMFFTIKYGKDRFSLNNFIFLGLASLFINGFIDFDWNLFPTFQITMVFISIMLWDDSKDKVIKKSSFFTLLYLFLSSIVVMLGVVNILTKILIYHNKGKVSLELFPYFYSQSKIFLSNDDFTYEERKSLYKLYENHSKFILDNIERSVDLEEKKELYEKLIEVNPWEITREDYLNTLKELDDYRGMGLASYNGIKLLNDLESQEIFQFSNKKKSKIVYSLERSANEHLKNNELDTAIKYYQEIYPIFYAQNNELINHYMHVDYISTNIPWGDYLLDYLIILYERSPDLAKEELLKIEKMHDQAVENGYGQKPFISVDLANLSVLMADDYLMSNNFSDAGQMYALAQKFNEWIFADSPPKFVSALETDEQKIEFWSKMDSANNKNYGESSNSVAKSYLPFLKKSLEEKDPDQIELRLSRIIEIAPWITSEMESDELLMAQELANYFIDRNDFDSANKIVKSIFKIGSYFGKMQLGNYYLMMGEKKMAEEAYLLCNKEWNEMMGKDHKDCLSISKVIESVNKEVYWGVSREILNN